MDLAVQSAGSCPLAWDSLVRSCSWGTFYHSGVNIEIIRAQTCAHLHFLTVEDTGGRLLGGIAFTELDGPLGPVFNALPFFGSYGDAVVASGAPTGTETALYAALLDFCAVRNALAVTVITSPFAGAKHHARVRALLNPFFVDARCCQMASLPAPDGPAREEYTERLLTMFEGRARTSYRRAIKDGLTVCRDPDSAAWHMVRKLHQSNIGSKGGRYKSDGFFKRERERAETNPDAIRLYVACDGAKIAGGILLYYFGDTVEYHTTGMNVDYRAAGPLNLLITEAMVDAGLCGFRRWNFGGTWATQEGVYRFKRSLGAEDHPYEYLTVFFRDPEPARRQTSEVLMSMYPGMFVLPFTELRAP